MRPRLLLRAAGVEARRALAYRFDFWVEAGVVFLASVALGWAVWTSVYVTSGVARIGGLDRDGMVLYVATVLLVSRIVRGTELGPGAVSQDVYDGALTRYLLQPVPYGPFKFAQHVGASLPAVVQLVVFGAPFLLLLRTHDAPVSAASLGMGVVSILVGSALQFALLFPVHCLAFRAENVWSLVILARFLGQLVGGVAGPISAFPAWLRPTLDALPFRHLYGEPVETLLGRRDAEAWALSLAQAAGWTAVLAVVGRLAFERGRRAYTGPGV